jgi:hypothetical protein
MKYSHKNDKLKDDEKECNMLLFILVLFCVIGNYDGYSSEKINGKVNQKVNEEVEKRMKSYIDEVLSVSSVEEEQENIIKLRAHTLQNQLKKI